MAVLFLIQLYNHSLSYFAETPLSAGPTARLFNLWQAAQFALKSFFPAWIASPLSFIVTSWAETTKDVKKLMNIIRAAERNLIDFLRLW